jgi:DNA-binding transcriptional LysR family regulator
VEPARQVLADLAVARSAVDTVVDLGSGRLEVAAHDLLTLDPLVSVLTAFHRRHAGVPVRLHEPQDEDELLRLLADGRCELAVTYLGARITRASGIRVVALGAQEVWALLPPSDAAVPDPLPLSALGHRAVVMSMSGFEAPRAAVGAAIRDAGIRMRPSVLTRHREALVPLVRAGAGVAFANRRYAELATEAGLVARRLTPSVCCEYVLLHREGSLSPAARGFVGVLARELGVYDGGSASHSQDL